MDPKMIEMQNLRVLNDYLNQTIDALSRQARFGQPTHLGFSPFGAIPTTTAGIGTDTVYNPWLGASMYGHTPFATTSAFAPVVPSYGAVDPFYGQRALSTFSPLQQGWSQIAEVSRQAQLCQALSARQSVLEAACRSCGIPV